jgi:ATP phosphoribosyltransferase
MEPKNLNKLLKVLGEYVEKPTISQLSGGGYDIFVILDEKELRYALPKLRASGASGIAVADVRMIL